jgi:hypothetical protein
MTIEANVRAALIPALERDLRRRRPARKVAVLTLVAATATTGVAAATGVIFAPPKPDRTVPAVPEWTYYAHDPYGGVDGPVLMRYRPEALARLNRDAEAVLARNGVTARCGTDPDHPRACFVASGDPVPGSQLGPVLGLADGPADYDVKPLSAADAHAWLCTHPTQRPGADGGELPPPAKGYEDC